MKHSYRKLGAALLLTGLLAAACGGDDDSPAASGDTTTTTEESTETSMAGGEGQPAEGKAAVESAASELRAGLTGLLEEHVYLAGIALDSAIANGGDLENPGVKAAVETLDANSVGLSEAIASVYGDAGGEQFLALWRAHIGFFVDYTLGGATGDTAKQEKARADLDGYRAEFGAFLASATEGGLPEDAVAEELAPHVESLLAAIDAALTRSPDTYSLLKEAAGHLPRTANVLAGGIASQFPDKF